MDASRQRPHGRIRQTHMQAALATLSTRLKTVYGAAAPRLILYGSEARGEAGHDSDVDLLLIYPRAVNRGEEIRLLAPLLAELNLAHGLLISILPVAEAEYQAATGPFWSNVRREGVALESARTWYCEFQS